MNEIGQLTDQRRYGVGELYGYDFSRLSPNEIQRLSSVSNKDQDCPFRGKKCKKPRGICTLRVYESRPEIGVTNDPLVTVCPERFKEENIINKWVAETLLGTDDPTVVSEVNFLSGKAAELDEEGKPVGRIDTILLRRDTSPLMWCAVELQAVYFSGEGMKSQFSIFNEWQGPGIPFPDKVRRPDFRSSGPKRLMPQLQTKVPTLRRWGKKMAVVTDRSFFENMGAMEEVNDVSNCDIVWFVLDHEKTEQGFRLVPFSKHYITLERAIEGLIAGQPVSLVEFERRISVKLSAQPSKKDRAR